MLRRGSGWSDCNEAAWAPPRCADYALGALAFMSTCAVVTCTVHFAVLTLSRQPAFSGQAWVRDVFSFQWPSVAYALDILARDIFFPFAALAFVGLAGVPLSDMQVRNIGIIGYAVLFPAATALMARIFGASEGATAV
jgi:hypothetical protein